MNTQDLVDNWRAHARRCDEGAKDARQVVAGVRPPMLGYDVDFYKGLVAINNKAAEVLRKCADELEQA